LVAVGVTKYGGTVTIVTGDTETCGRYGSCVLYTPPADGTCNVIDSFEYDAELGGSEIDTATVRVLIGCGCGNGELDAGEECDDGDTASGDGCSSTCHIES